MVAALFLSAYLFFVLKWSYSSGERAGWVQKLSHKGWFCKTWEGELAMVSMPGATPEKFFFTVWSDTVAEEINRNMGKRVALHYEEKIGIPTTCFGETRHFVTRITVVDQIPLAPGIVVPVPPSPAPTPQPPTAPATPQSVPTPPAAPQPATPPSTPAAPSASPTPVPTPAPTPTPGAPESTAPGAPNPNAPVTEAVPAAKPAPADPTAPAKVDSPSPPGKT